MTLDHIALLFINRGVTEIDTAYYILRSIGKIAFPIFVYLAVDGVYHTKNIFKYLMRLLTISVAMDVFGYIIGGITHMNPIDNALIGNAFTDLFLGVLIVYLLKKKNWYSFLVIIPIALSFLSHLNISDTYGTLIKADWGSFSIVLFFMFFIARELADYSLKAKARASGLDEDAFMISSDVTTRNVFSAIALVFVELVYYLIWRINYTTPILPNDFVPLGTYSTLALVFILLYSGKRGFSSKKIQYAFYLYYPTHILILGILSLFFGVLSKAY